MVNDVIISGTFLGFDSDNKLLLKIDDSNNEKILKVFVSNLLKRKLLNYLNVNNLIGIKGYIDIDKHMNINIITTKITILSDKKSS